MVRSRRLLRALGGLQVACSFSALAQSAPATVIHPDATVVQTISAGSVVSFGDEAMEFHRIVAIVPLRSGGLVVANGGSHQLRFFDSAGRLVREVGRRGGGPGEYQQIGGVTALPGDSLLVWDGFARRATVLAPNGEYVRAFALQAPFEGGGSVMRAVALSTGDVLIGFSEITTLAPSPVARSFGERLLLYSADGQRRNQTELRLASSDRFVQATSRDAGDVAYWSLAFGRSLTVRATPSGVATGDGTSWLVEMRDPRSLAITKRSSVDRAVAPVTAADIAAYRERSLRGEIGPDRVVAERMVDEMPFPKTQPAFARFEVDERGRIWFEEYVERRTAAPLWLRVDPGSRSSVAVRFPTRFQPRAFASGLVFGILRDGNDVEHVVAYSLQGLP